MPQLQVEEAKQAERSGTAAQRLLAVTCDASARLTADLNIAQPSPSLADLMMCRLGNSSKQLEGVPFLRYVDAGDQERLRSFIEESARASAPPRRLMEFFFLGLKGTFRVKRSRLWLFHGFLKGF